MGPFNNRSCGALLHMTSLPSPFGIGDMGPSARRLVDRLAESGHRYWQVLPLNPTSMECGNSPYTSESGYAGNPLLISPEILAEDGLLEGDLSRYSVPEGNRIDYAATSLLKEHLLKRAFDSFKGRVDLQGEYETFLGEHSGWLNDYALYKALWETHRLPWYLWPPPHRGRDRSSLEAQGSSERVSYHKFVQFLFFRQWRSLREYCRGRGIMLIGDLPYYVSHDSADVWANPQDFKLGPDSKPLFASGVPPDYFSTTGQLWGHPVYDWGRLQEEGFRLWMDRITHNLKLFDVLRIDHFRGLLAYWEVPAGEATAARGRWVTVPSGPLFEELSRRFPSMPFIAEDLGVITDDVTQAMRRLGLPGMRVLIFGFDGDPNNIHLPGNHPEDCVAYTGTHDTNTARGWFVEEATEEVRRNLFNYIGSWVPEVEVSWALMSLASRSRARVAIFPVQDMLSLGSESRMNRPSVAKDNYLWRLTSAQMEAMPVVRLREMAAESGRL